MNLRERTQTTAAIGGAVARVLGDPSYRAAARRIADEFRAYGTGERAAVLLESLVASRVR